MVYGAGLGSGFGAGVGTGFGAGRPARSGSPGSGYSFSSGIASGLAPLGYWKLDEASGDALDSSGNSLTLTDTNTVTSGTGKVGSARQFTAANSESFTVADPASLRLTNTTAIAISAWVNAATVNTDMQVVTKRTTNGTGANLEYMLRVDSNVPTFYIGGDGAGFQACTWSGVITASSYFHLFAGYDGNGTMFISVNAGTPVTASRTINITASGNPFQLGGTSTEYMNGLIDEVGLWRTAPTLADAVYLYNGGSGRTYG